MRNFMPGADIRVVEGIGTLGFYSVGNGRGSCGLQFQFRPEGGSECLPGVMRFKVDVQDDRTPVIAYDPPRDERSARNRSPILLMAEPDVVEAAAAIARSVLETNQSFLLFNLLSACDRGIDDIEAKRDQARSRLAYRHHVLARENAAIAEGSNEPRTMDETWVATAQDEYDTLVRDTEHRRGMLRTLRTELREWSDPKRERPNLLDLVMDRVTEQEPADLAFGR